MDRDLGESNWIRLGWVHAYISFQASCKRTASLSLTQVVAQPCYLHAEAVTLRDVKFWLPLFQRTNKLSCQVAHPVKTGE